MSNLYWLNEDQMARLRPFFPKSRGKPRVDDRRILSGIIFINRNGLRWSDAPAEYGPPKTLYNRWKRWSDMGVFARIMTGLAAEAADNQTISIDATYLNLVVFKSRIFSASNLRRFKMKTARYSDAQIMTILKQAEGGAGF